MASSTKRIEYIDALRGFTMILVVITHVAFFCMDIKDDSNYHHYLSQIRMPLFFLISGFVMYKEGVIWNLQHIGVFLKKKFIVQIVSTLFFFTLFSHYKNVDFIEGLKDPWKLGYWFTYTLFIYFVFYSTIRYICRKYVDVVIVIVAAVFYVINWPPLYQLIPIPDSLKSFLGVEKWLFFCFFLLGTLMKKHFDFVQRLIDKWITTLVCILVYFLLNFYQDIIPNSGAWGVIIQFGKTVSGLLIVFSFFRNNQSLFTKDKVLGRFLQYIGRRTLDIYLLHYFFLPYQLVHVTSIFIEYPMPIVEFVFSLIIALIVIAFCLLISNVIRLNPTLAYWLLGVKKE